MSTQAVTIRLPHPLYERTRRAARVQQRSIERLLLDAVSAGLPLLDDLPPDLVDEMAALSLLNDTALWRAARQTLSPEQQQQMDALLAEKGRGELTAEGQQTLDRLLAEYEHTILARAQAAVLLQQRGYDVTDPSVLREPAA